MTNLTKILVIIGIVLFGCTILLTRLFITERAEKIRTELNQNELLANTENIKLSLNKAEMQAKINKDSFLLYKKLKAKKVNEIIKTNIITKYQFITKLRDTVIYLNDTSKSLQYSFYSDEWANFYTFIDGDSTRSIYNINDKLYILNEWHRKKFLGLRIGKKINEWSFVNQNKNASYEIEYQIKKVK